MPDKLDTRYDELPEIRIFDVFRGQVTDEGMVYPALSRFAARERRLLIDRLQASLESSSKAFNNVTVLESSMILCAYELQVADANEKDHWQAATLELSQKLYGSLDLELARDLARDQIEQIQKSAGLLKGRDRQNAQAVIEVYERLAAKPRKTTALWQASAASNKMKSFLQKEYAEAFHALGTAPRELDAIHIHMYFERARHALADQDVRWKEWSERLTDAHTLSVSPADMTTNIGRYRPHLSKKDLPGLWAHETLVHALRTINGKDLNSRLSNPIVFNGYATFEEGLGVWVERCINGHLPQKAIDRYLDVVLATGVAGDTAFVNREQLRVFAMRRAKVHAAINNEDFDLETEARKVDVHVMRIFRGSPGKADDRAVFTRDALYYSGFIRVERYIDKLVSNGWSAAKIWRYITQAKFDPTKTEHAETIDNIIKK